MRWQVVPLLRQSDRGRERDQQQETHHKQSKCWRRKRVTTSRAKTKTRRGTGQHEDGTTTTTTTTMTEKKEERNEDEGQRMTRRIKQDNQPCVETTRSCSALAYKNPSKTAMPRQKHARARAERQRQRQSVRDIEEDGAAVRLEEAWQHRA